MAPTGERGPLQSPAYEDPVSCRKAISPYVTEAVTWIGERLPPVKTEWEGRKCPVCKQMVPGREWEEVVWVGEPVNEPSGTSGTALDRELRSLTDANRCARDSRGW